MRLTIEFLSAHTANYFQTYITDFIFKYRFFLFLRNSIEFRIYTRYCVRMRVLHILLHSCSHDMMHEKIRMRHRRYHIAYGTSRFYFSQERKEQHESLRAILLKFHYIIICYLHQLRYVYVKMWIFETGLPFAGILHIGFLISMRDRIAVLLGTRHGRLRRDTSGRV